MDEFRFRTNWLGQLVLQISRKQYDQNWDDATSGDLKEYYSNEKVIQKEVESMIKAYVKEAYEKHKNYDF